MHYRRWYRSVGKASGATRIGSPMERFMARVRKTEGCWLWTGSLNIHGYGSFGVGRGSRQNAHRWLWEQLNGKASSKLHLDHLCRNKACVNPVHMELVTHAENLRRGSHPSRPRKEHCPSGHPFDEANTYMHRGNQHCRACNREKNRLRRQRQAGVLANP